MTTGADALVRALREDPSVVVRRRAATALGHTRERDAVPALLDALASDHVAVRRDAALALGRIADPRALEPLLDALSAEPAVAAQAAVALSAFGGPDVAARLAEVLAGADSHDARAAAAMALGEIAAREDRAQELAGSYFRDEQGRVHVLC